MARGRAKAAVKQEVGPLAEYTVRIFQNSTHVEMEIHQPITAARLEASTQHVVRRWREVIKARLDAARFADRENQIKRQQEMEMEDGLEKRQ